MPVLLRLCMGFPFHAGDSVVQSSGLGPPWKMRLTALHSVWCCCRIKINLWPGNLWFSFSLPFWSWRRYLFSLELNFLALKWSFLHLVPLSVQFSRSVLSDSLRLHGLQHARPPCPSPTPGVHSNSCPSVSDVIQSSHPLYPLLFLLPIPPSIGVFSSESTLLMRWPKYWVSALASVLPMNTQDWSPLFIYW